MARLGTLVLAVVLYGLASVGIAASAEMADDSVHSMCEHVSGDIAPQEQNIPQVSGEVISAFTAEDTSETQLERLSQLSQQFIVQVMGSLLVVLKQNIHRTHPVDLTPPLRQLFVLLSMPSRAPPAA